MAQTNKSLRIHAARESARARNFLFCDYLHYMIAALQEGDEEKYKADRKLLTDLFNDMNKRLQDAEEK